MNATLAIVGIVLSILIPTFVYILTSTPEFKEVEKKVETKTTTKKTAAKPSAKKPSTSKVKEAVKLYKSTGKAVNDAGEEVELGLVGGKLTFVKSTEKKAAKPAAKAKPAVKPTPAAKPAAKATPAAKPAPAAKAEQPSPAVKAEEKVQIFDQVVAETMKPAEPKAAETTTPTTTQPEGKKE